MNLPATISYSLTGEVSSNSSVPIFCSSANNLIVIAGDRKIMKKTAPARKPRMVASENASETEATKKNPVIARNAAATTYAIGDAKYVRISLTAIVQTFPTSLIQILFCRQLEEYLFKRERQRR